MHGAMGTEELEDLMPQWRKCLARASIGKILAANQFLMAGKEVKMLCVAMFVVEGSREFWVLSAWYMERVISRIGTGLEILKFTGCTAHWFIHPKFVNEFGIL